MSLAQAEGLGLHQRLARRIDTAPRGCL